MTMDETAERPLDREVIDALVENHRAFLAFLEKRVGRREVAETSCRRPSRADSTSRLNSEAKSRRSPGSTGCCAMR